MVCKIRRMLAVLMLSLVLLPGVSYATELDNLGNNSPGSSVTDDNWVPSNQGNQGNYNHNNEGPDVKKPSEIIGDMRNQYPSDEGGFLKGNNLDKSEVSKGYEISNKVVRVCSYVVGWVIGLLVALLALVNVLGLFYVVIPIGFLRRVLSGGLYGNTMQNSMASGMGGMGMPRFGGMGGRGMMGGMGMAGAYRMGGMGMGGMNAAMNSQPDGNSLIRGFCVVPASAIQAVNMAEAGERGGMAGMSMGGFNGNQAVGGSAEPINPVAYYLKAQLVALFLTAVAIVLLVLSSVVFDTGIDAGNALVSFIGWVAHTIGLS